MITEFDMLPQEMAIEIAVLNETVREAEEYTRELKEEIEHLHNRCQMLENRLTSYGIDFEDIDELLDTI